MIFHDIIIFVFFMIFYDPHVFLIRFITISTISLIYCDDFAIAWAPGAAQRRPNIIKGSQCHETA